MRSFTILKCTLPLLLLSLLISANTITAQSTKERKGDRSFVVLPALGSTPETGFMFGGVGMVQFKMGNPDLDTRTSSVMASGVYTVKNQLSIGLLPSLFFEGEDWMLMGEFSYNYFPELFWGVGTGADNKMRMVSRQVSTRASLLKQFAPKLFAGVQLDWNRNYDMRYESMHNEPLDAPNLTGSNDYHSLGAGFILTRDTRNRLSYPTTGRMLEFSAIFYPEELSTLNSYTIITADLRSYLKLSQDDRSVIAFRTLSKTSLGTPPIDNLMLLGGQNLLRGYYQGRHRDRHGLALQLEWRQTWSERIGTVLFTDAGQVWNRFESISLANTRITAGCGLRFNVNKKERTHIRLDYGLGKGTSGMYITIGEAF